MSKGGPADIPEQQVTVEMTLASYRCWNENDFDGWLEYVYPEEFLFKTAGSFPDLPESYHGLDGARRFWRDFREMWDYYRIDIDRILAVGDRRQLVLLHTHARGREGIELDAEFAHLLTLRDGRCLALHAYPSWGEGLAAAGLADDA